MNVRNMKRQISSAIKREKKAEKKAEKTEDDKLRRAFLASAIALVIVGIVFIITMIIALGQLTEATQSSKASVYDLNCVTQLIEKPLTECKE